jgi:hypothetical protein
MMSPMLGSAELSDELAVAQGHGHSPQNPSSAAKVSPSESSGSVSVNARKNPLMGSEGASTPKEEEEDEIRSLG